MCWFALLQLMRWTGKTQIRNKMSWTHMLYPMNDLGHRGTCVTKRHDDKACMQRQSNPEQQTSGGAHTSQKRQSHQNRPTTLHEPPAATPQPCRCTFTEPSHPPHIITKPPGTHRPPLLDRTPQQPTLAWGPRSSNQNTDSVLHAATAALDLVGSFWGTAEGSDRRACQFSTLELSQL